jgi:hydrogenase nickel incorporation protein HypA/HybF
MHEFSVMTQIVDSIMAEATKRQAKKIEAVDLEVGEYTMLGDEQLKFAYEVLSKENPLLEGSELNIKHLKGRIKCKCGFEGDVRPAEDSPHKIVPILECPQCCGAAEIVVGRECVIRNIRMVVPDV